VFAVEADGLAAVAGRIDGAFSAACRAILASRGRVVCCGMGKSGHVARKIAATLASTGTPAFYVHPGEAAHGDLGMVTDADIVLALSYSGESDEVLLLLPALKRQGNAVIAMTGREQSTLAREADIHLDVSVPAEACPLALAPTSSTTASLAMGDALAVACWRRAASPPTISPARIRPAHWAGACCCTSPTSCMPATTSRRSARLPASARRWSR
jgi:arabinose-5-phosphate isomerase